MNPHNPVGGPVGESLEGGPFAPARGHLEHPLPRAPRASAEERAAADRTLSHGVPSRPLLGVLPIARWIPMDVHSMLDYGNAAMVAGIALNTLCPEARTAGLVLGAASSSVSLVTDYRLSVAKLIPIEVHEAIDHVWGVAAIAAPFVLGYWKKAPRVALVHVIAGAANILGSLITDYRSIKRARASGAQAWAEPPMRSQAPSQAAPW